MKIHSIAGPRSRFAAIFAALIASLTVACHPVQRTPYPDRAGADPVAIDSGKPLPDRSARPLHVSQPLRWIIADIKKPLRGKGEMTGPALNGKEPINDSNYQQILDGFKTNLHCNAIRIYIDPNIRNPTDYPDLYRKVVDYAKEINLAIYANPLQTADLRKSVFGEDKGAFAQWIVKYANYFQPQFLGPFNESGWDPRDMIEIVRMVRRRLDYTPKIVGPDMMRVAKTIEAFEMHPSLIESFDIIGSHNAGDDESANAFMWEQLRNLTGKPTWSSENPRPLSIRNAAGQQIGVTAVLDSDSIQGLVLYVAYPECVNADGSLTDKGREIMKAIGK